MNQQVQEKKRARLQERLEQAKHNFRIAEKEKNEIGMIYHAKKISDTIDELVSEGFISFEEDSSRRYRAKLDAALLLARIAGENLAQHLDV